MKNIIYFSDFDDLWYILNYYKIGFNIDIFDSGQDVYSYRFELDTAGGFDPALFLIISYYNYDDDRSEYSIVIKNNKLLSFIRNIANEFKLSLGYL